MVLLESFLADAQIFKTTFKNIKGGSHVSKKEKNSFSFAYFVDKSVYRSLALASVSA